jgi:hypothetical protein
VGRVVAPTRPLAPQPKLINSVVSPSTIPASFLRSRDRAVHAGAAAFLAESHTDLFRNVWMNQIVINDLEMHMNSAGLARI